MHSLIITVLFLITATLGFEESNKEVSNSELLLGLSSQVQAHQFSSLSSGQNATSHQPVEVLQERDVTFGPFSHVYHADNLVQWVFGNATSLLNISISTCLNQSDVVGVYQFENGSMTYDATTLDIITDLGLGTSKATPSRLNARTLTNSLSALNELEAFLFDDILTNDTSTNPSLKGRQVQFQSNGRIFALLAKTAGGLLLGMSAAKIANGEHTTSGQLAAGAIATAGSVAAFSIADIIAQEGGFNAIEPDFMQQTVAYVANVFIAMLRRLVLLFRGAPDNGQTRWTQAELREALDRQDVLSIWGADTTPGTGTTGASSDIRGFQDCEV